MRLEFEQALLDHQSTFGISLEAAAIAALGDYYDLVLEHNPLLHLVGPCSPAEFATRHILESLTMLEFLAEGARFADIGSGGGLPAIPCLIARPDLSAVLIESKEKKAKFLELARDALGLTSRAVVTAVQFAEADISGCTAISCRALDKFSERLPRLIKWASRRRLLIFGGEDRGGELEKLGRPVIHSRLMPLSDRRYLYIA